MRKNSLGAERESIQNTHSRGKTRQTNPTLAKLEQGHVNMLARRPTPQKDERCSPLRGQECRDGSPLRQLQFARDAQWGTNGPWEMRVTCRRVGDDTEFVHKPLLFHALMFLPKCSGNSIGFLAETHHL